MRERTVELRRIQIRQIVEAERRMVAVYTLDLLIAVPGPQRPKDKFGPVCRWKQSESIDTAMLTDPVPDLNMVRMRVLGEPAALACFVVKKPCCCSATSKSRRDASR